MSEDWKKLAELRKIASSATQGKWKWDKEWEEDGYHSGNMGCLNPDVLWYGTDGEESIYSNNRFNAAHIAAFNPTVALALLEAVEALRLVGKWDFATDGRKFNGNHKEILKHIIDAVVSPALTQLEKVLG